jgi:mannosylfructose-phosphate synthase
MTEDPMNSSSSLPRIAMVSTHGYVAAQPPLGAADTGGQVVYVLELSKKLAQLGYEVDIWTRRFEDQPEIEPVAEQVRIIRVPCGGSQFIPKEYLCHEKLPQWGENALRFIKRHSLKYEFINSHYWDAGMAGQHLSDALDIPHLHTPHSLGFGRSARWRTTTRGTPRSSRSSTTSPNASRERLLYTDADLVVATTPQQLDLLRRTTRRRRQLPDDPAGLRRQPLLPGRRRFTRAIRQRSAFPERW